MNMLDTEKRRKATDQLLKKIGTAYESKDYQTLITLAKKIVQVCPSANSYCYNEYACWECPMGLMPVVSARHNWSKRKQEPPPKPATSSVTEVAEDYPIGRFFNWVRKLFGLEK